MTSRFRLILATALGTMIAAPVLAQADILLPPYDGSQSPAAIATEDEALTALHQHGVTQISTLGRVGDYWEGEGLVHGKPVVAYLFSNGALRIEPARPGDRIRVQSAELPE